MKIILSDANSEKILLLSAKINMSCVGVVNAIIDKVKDVKIETGENAVGGLPLAVGEKEAVGEKAVGKGSGRF